MVNNFFLTLSRLWKGAVILLRVNLKNGLQKKEILYRPAVVFVYARSVLELEIICATAFTTLAFKNHPLPLNSRGRRSSIVPSSASGATLSERTWADTVPMTVHLASFSKETSVGKCDFEKIGLNRTRHGSKGGFGTA
jgi:hypothetical protein